MKVAETPKMTQKFCTLSTGAVFQNMYGKTYMKTQPVVANKKQKVCLPCVEQAGESNAVCLQSGSPTYFASGIYVQRLPNAVMLPHGV